MTQRVCAECGKGINSMPQVYFCDELCAREYLKEHDGELPDEYVTRDDQ